MIFVLFKPFSLFALVRKRYKFICDRYLKNYYLQIRHCLGYVFSLNKVITSREASLVDTDFSRKGDRPIRLMRCLGEFFMIIVKKINNNVAMARDDRGNELVVFG